MDDEAQGRRDESRADLAATLDAAARRIRRLRDELAAEAAPPPSRAAWTVAIRRVETELRRLASALESLGEGPAR